MTELAPHHALLMRRRSKADYRFRCARHGVVTRNRFGRSIESRQLISLSCRSIQETNRLAINTGVWLCLSVTRLPPPDEVPALRKGLSA
ncbi:hypothetical protein EVAR_57662_1 [Eumeta japonica]|uniref:Uncharacterized protein n=1 Tax=Eumeta variegata TaxID=151549 RepID=A0A4C1YWA9_EUMVA|nr:hypothetical protein EVAR_57662_1 [Eumeta japonica]